MSRSNKISKQKLFLFDIDGTILRFKQGIAKTIFVLIVKDFFGKIINIEKLPSFAGATDRQIFGEISKMNNIPEKEIESMFPSLWDRLAEEFKSFCSKEFIDLLPGADILINTLSKDKNILLGLVTGNFKLNAYQKLNVYDLGIFFPIGAFGCEFGDRNKLPPLAIERANNYIVKPIFNSGNSIIIGDSPRDIECAKKNDLKVICTATGGFSKEQLEKLGADFVFDDFSDIDNVLDVFYSI